MISRGGFPATVRQMLPLLFALACGGCVEHRSQHSVLRLWGDWNTLGRPALCCERLTHRPYKPARIDHFRWMYRRPVGRLAAEHAGIGVRPPLPVEAVDDMQVMPLLPDPVPPTRGSRPRTPPAGQDAVPPAPAPPQRPAWLPSGEIGPVTKLTGSVYGKKMPAVLVVSDSEPASDDTWSAEPAGTEPTASANAP